MPSDRKQASATRAVGKRGALLVEELLEAHGLIVSRVDGTDDIGRDFFVDVTREGTVTGSVVALQVKTGSAIRRGKDWVMPASTADLRLWAESSVPMFGVVVDLEARQARWLYVSDLAREHFRDVGSAPEGPFQSGPFGKWYAAVPEAQRLDIHPNEFVDAALTVARGVQLSEPMLKLASDDPEETIGAIYDCFALGRNDYRALLLLTRLLPSASDEALRACLYVISHASSNPDIIWNDHNWIRPEAKRDLRRRCRWGFDGLSRLLSLVDEGGIARATIGQAVLHVIELDSSSRAGLEAVAISPEADGSIRFWSVAIIAYWVGEAAESEIARLLRRAPDLERVDGLRLLYAHVQEHGFVDFL